MDQSQTYVAEIKFLNSKLSTQPVKIEWEPVPALGQLISQPIAHGQGKELIAKLRNNLGRKAGHLFNKIFKTAESKLTGGVRVIVVISVLREIFADQIDDGGGGGGRSYNPFRTRPTKGGI